MTITVADDGVDATLTLDRIKAVVEAANAGFTVDVGVNGANTIAEADAVAAASFSSGQDVVTLTTTETNTMGTSTLATGNVNTDFAFQNSAAGSAGTVTGTSAWSSKDIVLTITGATGGQLKTGYIYMQSATTGNAGAVEDISGNAYNYLVDTKVTIN